MKVDTAARCGVLSEHRFSLDDAIF